MPGSMTQTDLVADLKAELNDAASKFTAAVDADFKRHLDAAALDLSRYRKRTLLGSVTLVADQPAYDPPAGLWAVKYPLWGTQEKRARNPWDENWPGRLPRPRVVETVAGRQLYLEPAPTGAQISDLGSTYQFYYFAAHVISDVDGETTVQPGDRQLLLVRAAAEALQELAHKGVMKPVKLGDGMGAMPSNSTPAALGQLLFERFTAMAQRLAS